MIQHVAKCLADLFPVVICIATLSARDCVAATDRPNIVLILTDDQGYGDLSCHGNPIIRTPNMDRLHDEGARFVDFHVSPTCAPTRSALMTGRHEFRNGVTHTILERERLSLDAVTIAQILQGSGYATGIFGKWHLGDEAPYQPGARGFGETFIHGGGGIGQSYPGSCGDAPGNTYFDPALLHNGQFEKTSGYCTDLFFNAALAWIDEVRGKQPFFAYISLNAPHAPLQVRPEDEQRYSAKVPEKTAKFFGMIANIDDNIGKVLAQLETWNIDDQTLVVFMNDNGGTGGVNVYNAGMRGSKGSPWIGGTRAASFWRWPGTIAAGDRKQLTAHIDFFPTLVELAEVEAPLELREKIAAQVEGRSLAPLLLGDREAVWPERTLFTHQGRWKRGEASTAKYVNCSVRRSQWHLICNTVSGEKGWRLFDLAVDPGEERDVFAEHPDVVRDLEQAYDAWWESVQTQLVNEDAVGPKVNPFKALYWRQFGGGPAE